MPLASISAAPIAASKNARGDSVLNKPVLSPFGVLGDYFACNI
jgi:hypothetical protein